MLLADLLAGTASRPCPMPAARPRILVLDSGLGGLTVLAELMRLRPDADYRLRGRRRRLSLRRLAPRTRWSPACLAGGGAACRRASRRTSSSSPATPSRPWSCRICARRFDLPFVGTVPAIKPAAAASRTRRITRAGDARHGRARLHARPDRGLCRRIAGSTSSARACWPAMRRPSSPARPSPDEALCGRASRPASSTGTGAGRTWSSSPARITRCCAPGMEAARALARRLDRSRARHRAPRGRVLAGPATRAPSDGDRAGGVHGRARASSPRFGPALAARGLPQVAVDCRSRSRRD